MVWDGGNVRSSFLAIESWTSGEEWLTAVWHVYQNILSFNEKSDSKYIFPSKLGEVKEKNKDSERFMMMCSPRSFLFCPRTVRTVAQYMFHSSRQHVLGTCSTNKGKGFSLPQLPTQKPRGTPNSSPLSPDFASSALMYYYRYRSHREPAPLGPKAHAFWRSCFPSMPLYLPAKSPR